MPSPIPFADNVEQTPDDEAEDVERILNVMRQLQQRRQRSSGRPRRDVHVKAHGCAVAQFNVIPQLPSEMAQGLFKQAQAYPAFVRFSNSAPWPQPDAVPDGRGMAIQVENNLSPRIVADDRGRTQDFVMVNNPTFIARDVKDYLQLEEARVQATQQPLKLATKLLRSASNPLQWRWRALLAAARVAGQLPSHPANYIYYSMVPIRFGTYVAKYRVRPASPLSTSLLTQATTFALHSDAMRRLFEGTLAKQEIRFDFQVQLRTSHESMPIEDATVDWPESESPFQSVAELVLPRQNISIRRTREESDQRAFNVWHGLLDHRPLGGINRARRQAYALSAVFRDALRSESSG